MDLLLIIVVCRAGQQFRVDQVSRPVPFFSACHRTWNRPSAWRLATAFVLTLASVASYLLTNWVLSPLDLMYLSTVGFIVVVAALVQLTELFMRHSAPLLHRVLGIYLPLITSNCAVLGVALLNVREKPLPGRVGRLRPGRSPRFWCRPGGPGRSPGAPGYS